MNRENGSERKGLNGKAVASFILGILSIIIVIIPFVGFVLGVVGFILGMIGLKEVNRDNREGKSLAIAGIIFNIIGLSFSILWVVISYMTFTSTVSS
ncbi:DUF4190 domain-containing protein [Rossellomorea arthrocnemi]|jgi:hypothetical protein|uniref:DUF4190 domain-containing protein n=1 Tax=Rossellomorea arthrocnemi TaxID=2769542 RepID=UPI001918320A|nr:DUF4190 domain-containing protein [Rossellomorea arthrocnemi]